VNAFPIVCRYCRNIFRWTTFQRERGTSGVCDTCGVVRPVRRRRFGWSVVSIRRFFARRARSRVGWWRRWWADVEAKTWRNIAERHPK
jgi:hypothetical protein